MNELTGAHLSADQRQAIRDGELKVNPPRCSANDCWRFSTAWVVVEHPKLAPYNIPRCEEHKDEQLPYEAIETEPIHGDP